MEVLLDVLSIIARHGPIRQTHVMYKANLAWEVLKRDLSFLCDLKTVERIADKEGILYRITPLGLEAITHYSKVQTILNLSQTEDL